MHYLIDGHNLIGKMPDINLEDPDDEIELVLRLRSWAARGRKRKITVIFDHGLPGGEEKGLSTGQVKVLFAPTGRTADSLLIKRIQNVRNPGEFTLVSSDLQVVRSAEKRRMPVLTSEAFVERLNPSKADQEESAQLDGEIDNPSVSVEDVDMWLEFFSKKPKNDKKS